MQCDIDCDADCEAACHASHYIYHKKEHPDDWCQAQDHIYWLDPVLGPWRCAISEEEAVGLTEFYPHMHFFYGPITADFRYAAVKERLN